MVLEVSGLVLQVDAFCLIGKRRGGGGDCSPGHEESGAV